MLAESPCGASRSRAWLPGRTQTWSTVRAGGRVPSAQASANSSASCSSTGRAHERAGGAPGQEIVRLGAGQSYDTSAAEEFVRTAIAVALAHGGQQQQGSEHSRDDGEKPRPPILRFLVGRPQEDRRGQVNN